MTLVLVGFLVTAGLLWWTMHDVNLSEMWSRVRGVSGPQLMAAILLAVLSIACGGVRWRYLFPSGEEPPTASLVQSSFIAAMANNVLPLRTGELAGAVALNKISNVPIATGLSSLLASRVLDVAAIAGMLSIALLGSVETSVGSGLAAVTGVSAFVLVVLLVLFARSSGLMLRLSVRFFDWLLPPRPAAWVETVLIQLFEGLAPLASRDRLVWAMAWSILSWTLNALSIWFGLLAFGVQVSPWAAFTLQGLIAIAIALPSSPGFFGPYEAAGRVALSLYAIDASTAVGFVLPFHVAVNFLPAIAAGLLAVVAARDAR